MPGKAEPKRTILYKKHKDLGAKLIDFGGWLMPVSYSSVLKEHEAVRTGCGVFDVSHMGEAEVTGPAASNFVNFLVTNDVAALKPGCAQYAGMLNEEGGFIDDLIVYRLAESHFLLCINASNIDKDIDWILKKSKNFDVTVSNKSGDYAQIALQGPKSSEVVEQAFPEWKDSGIEKLDYMTFMTQNLDGNSIIVSRTGYTGESGYEFYLPLAAAETVWQRLIDQPAVVPCGLGARDTLRLESCYLLYGNDMNETTTPLEAGISWAVKLEKGSDFIGREALQKEKSEGSKRKMIAFKLLEAGIPRSGMSIFQGGTNIGVVTSGSVLPSVGGSGGMALILKDTGKVGDEITIDVRGKRKLARIEKRPLYSPRTR